MHVVNLISAQLRFCLKLKSEKHCLTFWSKHVASNRVLTGFILIVCECIEVPVHFLLSELQPPAWPGLRESVADLQNPFPVASLNTQNFTHTYTHHIVY